MDLLEEIGLGPRPGKGYPRAVEAVFGEPADLTADEIAALEDARRRRPEGESTVAPLARIRDRHHAVARCFASGMSTSQVAAVTGYDVGRLNTLVTDPTMTQLISHYRSMVDESFVDMHARMATLSADVVAEIQDRLELEPEKISMQDLKDLLKTTADRTGFGPTTKSVSVNVNLGMAQRLEEARRRAREASQIVDVVAVDVGAAE